MTFDGIKGDFIKRNQNKIDAMLSLVSNIDGGHYPMGSGNLIVDKYNDGSIQLTCMNGGFDESYSMVVSQCGRIEFGLGKLSWWDCKTNQDMINCLYSIADALERLHKKLNKPKFIPLIDRFKAWMNEDYT